MKVEKIIKALKVLKKKEKDEFIHLIIFDDGSGTIADGVDKDLYTFGNIEELKKVTNEILSIQ